MIRPLLHAPLCRPRTWVLLARSAAEHRSLEYEYARRLRASGAAPDALVFPALSLPSAAYVQRNVFSILFLSIFSVLGIPRARRRMYGLVFHTVRGIVTCADNILDAEDKGAVRLRLQGGRVLPDIMLMLFHHRLLRDAVEEAAEREPGRRAYARLERALAQVAQAECSDEGGVPYALTPGRLLRRVHRFRGRRLLELAFVVPESLEGADVSARLREARGAVGLLGLGLQALDDVTDFERDVAERRHNLLRSWIVHRAEDGRYDDEALRRLDAGALAHPEHTFPRSTEAVVARAMSTMRRGFLRLHRLGHPMDEGQARALARTLFSLRGLGHLWDLAARSSGSERGTPAARAPSIVA